MDEGDGSVGYSLRGKQPRCKHAEIQTYTELVEVKHKALPYAQFTTLLL